MTSRLRSASKKRLSSLFARSPTPNSNSKMSSGPFLHLKFGAGRPPPHEHEHTPISDNGGDDGSEGAGSLLFAHEVELVLQRSGYDLPDSLRTDVQRTSVARWLEQNFRSGTYLHDVVHKREGDEGMFVLVTKNWARSVGDPVRCFSGVYRVRVNASLSRRFDHCFVYAEIAPLPIHLPGSHACCNLGELARLVTPCMRPLLTCGSRGTARLQRPVRLVLAGRRRERATSRRFGPVLDSGSPRSRACARRDFRCGHQRQR